MIDLKNEADTCIHTTEKSLQEHKANIKSEIADEIQVEINNLRNLINDSEAKADALKEQIEKTKNSAMKIGQSMYQN